ncbi:MAG TPA: hypothetical protein VE377_01430 [Candidatus Dormibacteraeota bacterium]|nr:hypothetical protein [Candidatus Dormibacteraeota bacterium]
MNCAFMVVSVLLLASALPVAGETNQRTAAINKKVVGKWWSSDAKHYIEFLPNTDCSEGSLLPDGEWHVERGKLWVREYAASVKDPPDEFGCSSGELALTGPNTLTRDYGMGGRVEEYHRAVKHAEAVPKKPQ